MSTETNRQAAIRTHRRTYQGTPCKHGHAGIRYTGNKACIECTRVYGKAHKQTNSESEKARKRAYKQTHRELERQAKRAYYARNRDAVLTRNAAARARAKQESAPLKARIKTIDRAIHEHDKAQALAMGSHVKRYKQWIKRESTRKARENMNPIDRAIYKHSMREAYRRKLQSNPEAVRMVWRVNRTKRRNRANNDPLHRLSTAQVLEVFTWQGGACAYCGEKHGLHLDHMTPLSRGGLHSQRNIQFLCAYHNMHKHTLTDREYRTIYDVPLVTPWDVL